MFCERGAHSQPPVGSRLTQVLSLRDFMKPSLVAESAMGPRFKGFAKPFVVVKRLIAVTMRRFRPARGARIETGWCHRQSIDQSLSPRTRGAD